MNPKKEVLVAVLAESWAWLQIDGRVAGVELPDWLKIPSVTLQIGYDMPLPIPDLRVDDEGVRCTLSFQRTPFTCRIPWKAIWAIADVDGHGAIYPDDVPPDVAPDQIPGRAAPEPARPAPRLCAVPSDSERRAAAPRPAPRPALARAEVLPPDAPDPAAGGGEPGASAPAADGKRPDRLPSGKPRPSHLKLV